MLFQTPLWFLHQVLLKVANKASAEEVEVEGQGSSKNLYLSLSSLPGRIYTQEFKINQSDTAQAPHFARLLLQSKMTPLQRIMIVTKLARTKQISNELFRCFVHEGLMSGNSYEVLCVVSAFLFTEERPVLSQDFCIEQLKLIPFAAVIILEELYSVLSTTDAPVTSSQKDIFLIALRLEDRDEDFGNIGVLSISDWIASKKPVEAEIEIKKVRGMVGVMEREKGREGEGEGGAVIWRGIGTRREWGSRFVCGGDCSH